MQTSNEGRKKETEQKKRDSKDQKVEDEELATSMLIPFVLEERPPLIVDCSSEFDEMGDKLESDSVDNLPPALDTKELFVRQAFDDDGLVEEEVEDEDEAAAAAAAAAVAAATAVLIALGIRILKGDLVEDEDDNVGGGGSGSDGICGCWGGDRLISCG